VTLHAYELRNPDFDGISRTLGLALKFDDNLSKSSSIKTCNA